MAPLHRARGRCRRAVRAAAAGARGDRRRAVGRGGRRRCFGRPCRPPGRAGHRSRALGLGGAAPLAGEVRRRAAARTAGRDRARPRARRLAGRGRERCSNAPGPATTLRSSGSATTGPPPRPGRAPCAWSPSGTSRRGATPRRSRVSSTGFACRAPRKTPGRSPSLQLADALVAARRRDGAGGAARALRRRGFAARSRRRAGRLTTRDPGAGAPCGAEAATDGARRSGVRARSDLPRDLAVLWTRTHERAGLLARSDRLRTAVRTLGGAAADGEHVIVHEGEVVRRVEALQRP